MARLSNPILFSSHFEINTEVLEAAGFIDPFLTVDTPLFIDPVLLDKSSNDLIRRDGYQTLRKHFENIIRLLKISNKVGDIAWRTAQKHLSFKEARFNGLGYGTSERAGASRPNELRDIVLNTAKEIIELGSKDPEMISLMGFFEENVGPDTISDLTSRIIEPYLAQITYEFCRMNNLKIEQSQLSPEIPLPHFRTTSGKLRAIVLVPSDIVRELPVANDWEGVQGAINANKEIRDRVNEFLTGITYPTITERKEALHRALYASPELIDTFIAAVKEFTTCYDPDKDILGYEKLKEVLINDIDKFKNSEKYKIEEGIDEIKRVVKDTLDMFAHHVEKGNLWEALWSDGKPKKERAAQLLYFAMADCFCKANNIDISPEANMGGGPIDFKYSKGYNARVLIEMKRSHGTVVHGYLKQLEIYKNAARTEYGIFVIIDYGNLGEKLNTIEKIRQERLAAGEIASDIIVIDAQPKKSASIRE